MSGPVPLPLGPPVAWSNDGDNAQAGTFGTPSRPPEFHPVPSSPAPGRAGRLRREAVERDLSGRDWTVLEPVALHRFLSTRQVERLHFADHASALSGARTARRVLRRLAGMRVLDHLERRIGGVRAGSASYVWRLGPVGHRLLRQRAHPLLTQRPSGEPGLRFLQHTLAVGDVHLALRDLHRRGERQLLELQLEPASWRFYLGAGGERLTLKPDLYAVTATDAYEDHCFLEVDRGTESLPALLAQCQRYQAYRRSGQEQARLGVFPIVIWLVSDVARAERLRRAIRRSGLDPALFGVGLAEELPRLLAGAAP
jgi:hypothetical protein